MSFGKFTIISDRNVQALEETNEDMIFNLNHIVSVKPIKIPMAEKVIDGFWIRTSNGKKYRAVSAPDEIKNLLNS